MIKIKNLVKIILIKFKTREKKIDIIMENKGILNPNGINIYIQ